MINKLRKLNNDLLNCYNIDSEEYHKQLQIKNMLIDDGCFYKIKIETAYSILRDLGIQESDIKSLYKQLIRPSI